MNAGVYFVTQNTDDLLDEKLKNNLGLKFAFRSTDINEIKKTLAFFGVDSEDENNQKRLRDLENGQCLISDLSSGYLLYSLAASTVSSTSPAAWAAVPKTVSSRRRSRSARSTLPITFPTSLIFMWTADGTGSRGTGWTVSENR